MNHRAGKCLGTRPLVAKSATDKHSDGKIASADTETQQLPSSDMPEGMQQGEISHTHQPTPNYHDPIR